MSVINALVVALCMKKQKEVVSTLETLEQLWEYQVYSGDELNPVSGPFSVNGMEKADGTAGEQEKERKMERKPGQMNKILVVGGGAAGMMAAVTAARNGKKVL